MKKLFIRSRLAFLLFAIIALIASCSKHDSNDDNGGGGSSNLPPAGSWVVSLYFDTGDETAHFAGYSFSFQAGGVVSASNGATTVTGTWSQTSTKFILAFPAGTVFEDLSDDWLIVEKTATSIKLKDDNPAQDDRLEFTRQ